MGNKCQVSKKTFGSLVEPVMPKKIEKLLEGMSQEKQEDQR